jgi:hypothetical protein
MLTLPQSIAALVIAATAADGTAAGAFAWKPTRATTAWQWVTGWDRAAEAAPGRVMDGLRLQVLAGTPSLALLRALAVWRWGSPAWTGCLGFWPVAPLPEGAAAQLSVVIQNHPGIPRGVDLVGRLEDTNR